jgi:hypothetical protein
MNSSINLNNSQPAFSMPLFLLIANVYTIPAMAAVGFVLNLFCFVVLLHPQLSGDTYKYLVLKTLIHLLGLLMTSLTALTNCAVCELNQTYGAQILRVMIMFTGNSVTTMAALVEIFLSYDRLLMFKSIKRLPNLSFSHAAAITISSSLIINMPNFFATHIVQLAPNRFASLRSLVAESLAYRVFSIVLNLGQALMAFILLLILNVLVTIEFNKYIKKKSRLTKSKSVALSEKKPTKSVSKSNTYEVGSIDVNSVSIEAKQSAMKLKSTVSHSQLESTSQQQPSQKDSAELNFTWMIVIASLCFTLTRLVQFITAVTSNIMQLQGIVNSMTVIYMTILSFSLTMIYYGSSLFFYLIFNKRIRHYFRRIFHI